MSGLRWQLVNDSAAIAWLDLPHPHKPRARAWISVSDADDLHRCMIAIERALKYGKVPPEVRAALQEGA